MDRHEIADRMIAYAKSLNDEYLVQIFTLAKTLCADDNDAESIALDAILAKAFVKLVYHAERRGVPFDVRKTQKAVDARGHENMLVLVHLYNVFAPRQVAGIWKSEFDTMTQKQTRDQIVELRAAEYPVFLAGQTDKAFRKEQAILHDYEF